MRIFFFVKFTTYLSKRNDIGYDLYMNINRNQCPGGIIMPIESLPTFEAP